MDRRGYRYLKKTVGMKLRTLSEEEGRVRLKALRGKRQKGEVETLVRAGGEI